MVLVMACSAGGLNFYRGGAIKFFCFPRNPATKQSPGRAGAGIKLLQQAQQAAKKHKVKETCKMP
jgi:hypothetical protein